jgi:catechol 2,3-dioxygenase-like lactoylglutathione lyase family enzyme
MSDIAHLGPVELLTPDGEESLRFFVDVMGMEVEHTDGAATYLRGWGDYQPWSLKLVASDTSGMGVLGLRAASPDALRRRVAAVAATGLGEGWVDGDRGRGRGYRFRDPDGHRFELYYECERYAPPPHLRPSLKNVPGRYTARGCAVKRLDHVNVLAADVRANRDFCVDAHGAKGRLHHLAFWVDTREECLRAADIWLDAGIEIEAAPSKHAIAQGFFLYGIEPGGNRIEVTTGGRFVYAPDEPCVVWTEAERAKGQAWGVQTVPSFHTYGTPPVT